MMEKGKESKFMQDSRNREQKIFGLSSSLSKDLSELNKKVAITNAQLIECTTNQEKFHAIIQNLNTQGIARIFSEQYEQSLIYFGEAERILQYVASCGKIIDRSLIIAILHNIGCAYQKLYDLPKLASYLEALIYNLGISLDNSEPNVPDFLESDKVFLKGTWEHQCLCVFLKKKMDYGRYHLQFSALNSKNFQHDTAIAYAKQAIQIFKQVCTICDKYEIHLKNGENAPNLTNKVSVLSSLSRISVQLNPINYENYIKKIRKLLMKGYPIVDYSQQVSAEFSKFSIGKVIQMNPLKISDCNTKIDLEIECTKIQKVRKALYISAGFFTIGTEYRLLSSASQSKNQNCKSSDQFLYSELYHIFCILTVLTYVPCQTLFLSNLLTSYNNHYEGELEKSIRKRPFIYCEENQQNKESLPIQILPEHSSIQEGESKWSRSQLKSLSEENTDQIFIKKSEKQKNKILMIKKKSKVGIQYKVNFNNIKSVTSLGKMSSAERSTDSFKDGYKHKTEHSVKKSSLSKSLREKTKSSDKRKKTTKQKHKGEQKIQRSNHFKLVNSRGQGKGANTFKHEYLSPSGHKMSKSKNKSREISAKNKSNKQIKSISKEKRGGIRIGSKIFEKKGINQKDKQKEKQKEKERIQKNKRSKSKKSAQKKKIKKNNSKTNL